MRESDVDAFKDHHLVQHVGVGKHQHPHHRHPQKKANQDRPPLDDVAISSFMQQISDPMKVDMVDSVNPMHGDTGEPGMQTIVERQAKQFKDSDTPPAEELKEMKKIEVLSHVLEARKLHFGRFMWEFYTFVYFRFRVLLLSVQFAVVGMSMVVALISTQSYVLSQVHRDEKSYTLPTVLWILLNPFIIIAIALLVDSSLAIAQMANSSNGADAPGTVFPWKFVPQLLEFRGAIVSVVWSAMSPRPSAPKAPSWRALLVVELLCPVALEIVPIAFACYSASHVPFASAWCAWSVVIMATYCILYSACKILCYRWPRAAAVFAHVTGKKYSIDYRKTGIDNVQTPTDHTTGRHGTLMPIWGVTAAIIKW
jgi:hypothetical protein